MKESIEQKIKESDDEKIRTNLIVLFKREFGENSNVSFAGIKVKDIIVWLEKEGEQKNAWSEDDKKCLENAIIYCEWARDKAPDLYCYETSEKSINWLKSLRPQNRWKPTEVQMKSLKEACDEHWEPDGLDPLYTLYQDLKKLREE
jgi:hypothetical protein